MERKVKDFSRSEIQSIAIHYGNSGPSFSAQYYTSLLNISYSTFYTLLGRAIKEHMVSEQMARKIARKSAANSERHGGLVGKSKSWARYQRLIEQRKTFEFSRDRKEYYAMEYANSDFVVDMDVFAGIHCMSKSLLQRTLISAVVDNIVKDDVVEKLEQKASQHNPSWKVKSFFENLRKQRKENLEAKKLRQKQRRLQRRQVRKESEDMLVWIDALMLNPDDSNARKQLNLIQEVSETTSSDDSEGAYDDFDVEIVDYERLQHLRFIQRSMQDYGIPDEIEEQRESLVIAYSEHFRVCSGRRPSIEQISFFV